MIRVTEGLVHLRMRDALKSAGFQLVAGEFPGGTDHELYPLNVTDPAVARDLSPDPRRHSVGELIPDIVAYKDGALIIGEAKVDYNLSDQLKLEKMFTSRLDDLVVAITRFAVDRGFTDLLPVNALTLLPALIFTDRKAPPAPSRGLSYLILTSEGDAHFLGPISEFLR